MTMLDERIRDVLWTMPVLPEDVRDELMRRLAPVEEAVNDGMLEEGTILIPFRDLDDEDVVLAFSVREGLAFLDISTADDAVALSNGYRFRDQDGIVSMLIDRQHRLTSVDHGKLAAAARHTDRALAMIAEAQTLMETHAAFRGRRGTAPAADPSRRR